jgi:hypothetical protein
MDTLFLRKVRKTLGEQSFELAMCKPSVLALEAELDRMTDGHEEEG